MVKTIYFIRHGHFMVPHPRPESYKTRHLKLSVAGVEDIIELGHKIREREKHVSIIYSGPYKRAVQSAEILSKIFHCVVEVDEKINEETVGFKNIHHFDTVYKRFSLFVDKAIDHQGNAIIVSHELPISVFVSKESGVTYEEMMMDHKHLELLRMGEGIAAKFNGKKFISFEKL